MDAARDEARRHDARALSVAMVHTNVDAGRFYEREGFRPFYVSMLAPLPASRSGFDKTQNADHQHNNHLDQGKTLDKLYVDHA